MDKKSELTKDSADLTLTNKKGEKKESCTQKMYKEAKKILDGRKDIRQHDK